ncbi:MAG: tetratricopeptide repeat protein [Calditrichaeota bacterium]|nr:tetratricopeptide repeat protein [Calditrichota bacterium]
MKKVLFLLLFAVPLLIFCGKKEVKIQSLEGMEPPALLEKGHAAFIEGNMEEAIRAYQVIYNRYPLSREYISAVLGMARAYNNMGDFERGFELLHNLIRENMVPSRVPEIYNEMARYYEVTAVYSREAGISNIEKDYKQALTYYQKAVSYPNSENVEAKSYAQFQIGELHQKLGHPEDAALAYQSAIFHYPGTEWATLAQQRIQELKTAGETTLTPLHREETEAVESPN